MFAAISGLPVSIRILAIVRRDDCTGGASRPFSEQSWLTGRIAVEPID